MFYTGFSFLKANSSQSIRMLSSLALMLVLVQSTTVTAATINGADYGGGDLLPADGDVLAILPPVGGG